jgi:hypothetical protein
MVHTLHAIALPHHGSAHHPSMDPHSLWKTFLQTNRQSTREQKQPQDF